MTNRDIQDLTIRLSQALDQNYDVINMETVLSVISALEGTTITKEQLETTRLAKYINHLRRRTKSENLARRAKTLLKRWREMVGIQQSSNDTSSQITNPNVAICENTNLSEIVIQQTDEQQYTQSFTNNEELYSSRPISVHSSQQSQVSTKHSKQSIVSKGANTINTKLKTTKIKNVHQHQLIASGTNSESVNSFGKQPISFANLIPGIVNDNSNNRLNIKENKQHHLQHVPTLPTNYLTETYVIDHSSNSSGDSKTILKNQPVCDPIIIDIQDSDSESNLKTEQSSQKLSAPVITNTTKNITSATKSKSGASKSKKAKKDKKRKDDLFPNKQNISCLNVVSDSCSNPYQRFLGNDEEKSMNSYPAANISEILSLSNTSMSTFFTGENDKSSFSSNNNRDLAAAHTKNDLTFAGKFQSNNLTHDTSAVLDNGSNQFVSNLGAGLKTSSVKNASQQKSLNCNSNDSSSSRLSHYELIDVVSQDNNQTKIVQELRSKKNQDVLDIVKNSTWDNIIGSTQTASNSFQKTTQSVNASEVKIPKKRGRKKGSKGVDSIIAKETGLSSEMLISSLGSGGKKVKTTKELYAEIQNRKLGATQKQRTMLVPLATTNRTIGSQLSSRPESSCSELSLHSPQTLDTIMTTQTTSTINAIPDGDSDSATVTSEPSHGSTDTRKQIISMDSNSNSQFSRIKASLSSGQSQSTFLTTLQKDLNEIIKHIPFPRSKSEIERDCNAGEAPCTCKVIELYEQLEDKFEKNVQSPLNELSVKNEKIEYVEGPSADKLKISESVMEDVQAPKNISKQLAKPIKSIFDLDFDDEDDPLNIIKAEVEAEACKEPDERSNQYLTESVDQMELNKLSAEPKQLHSHQIQSLTTNDPPNTLLENLPVYPLYKVEENPDCAAKNQFEIRTQKITQFHIDLLHNFYIPNINGNWDQADLLSNKLILESLTNIVNIVPKYGSFEVETIVKDLSNIVFQNKNGKNVPPCLTSKLHKVPFLGVARPLLERLLVHPSLKKITKSKRMQEQDQKKGTNLEYPLMNDLKEETNANSNKSFEFAEHVDRNSCILTPKITEFQMENSLLKSISVEVEPRVAEDNINFLKNELVDECNNQNLLEIANVSSPLPIQSIGKNINQNNLLDESDKEMRDRFTELSNHDESSSSRRSSSCSNSSLKITQQSINLKLRRLQLRQEQENQKIIKGTNRKRRRKKNLSQSADGDIDKKNSKKKTRTIKRLKIAINGDVATQRQVSLSCSNSTDENCNNDSSDCENESSIESDNSQNNILNDNGNENSTIAEYDSEDMFCKYDEEDSSSAYHEVVTRASSANGNNHIVLTFKKTPSNTNSPSKSISALSSVIKKSSHNLIQNTNAETLIKQESTDSITNCAEIPLQKCLTKNNEFKSIANTVTRNSRCKNLKTDTNIDLFTPVIANMRTKVDCMYGHGEYQNLFFPDELLMVSKNGFEKEYILNINSCDDNCLENKDWASGASNADCKHSDRRRRCFQENCEESSGLVKKEMSENLSSDSESDNKSNIENQSQEPLEVAAFTELYADEIEESNKNIHTSDELLKDNNGLLSSFNNIYPESNPLSNLNGNLNEKVTSNTINSANDNIYTFDKSEFSKNNKNCDEHNVYDNNKYSKQTEHISSDEKIVKNNSKYICKESNLNNVHETSTDNLPYKEYRTGLRAVDEDVQDEDGNNCARIQQFKEWHQVLQLRSYNDELLTVLPYVVLD